MTTREELAGCHQGQHAYTARHHQHRTEDGQQGAGGVGKATRCGYAASGFTNSHTIGGKVMEGTGLNWRKSSYSGNGGQSWVGGANTDIGLLRGTTHRPRPLLAFCPAAWGGFADRGERSLWPGCGPGEACQLP